MVVKEGMVYRLTEKGRELARFVKDVDRIWSKLESTLSGEHTSVFSCAEQFEAETGIKMQKTTSMFHGMDLIMDERRVIGILAQEDCSRDFSSGTSRFESRTFSYA